MNKPFHLMTPAEKTVARIAQNRAIAEKIADDKNKRPPEATTSDFTRATPDDRARVGGLIRKVPK